MARKSEWRWYNTQLKQSLERLFLVVPRGCLRYVIVVFPDHTHYFRWVLNNSEFKSGESKFKIHLILIAMLHVDLIKV